MNKYYFEYKNLVKNLFTDDPWVLNQVFENTLKSSVKGDNDINIFDKVKILLFITSSIVSPLLILKIFFFNIISLLIKL